MDKRFEAEYHRVEEASWWFIARRKSILALLADTDRKARILDIGCSGGPLLADLKTHGFENAIGADFSAEAVAKCTSRGLHAVEMNAQSLTFPPQSFDVIVASDSLEHLEHEDAALASWHRVLEPGGRLFVFVPAHRFLWSQHDEINHHHRRYSRRGLEKRLEATGFTVKRSGYWNFAMFFPVVAVRLWQQAFRRAAAPEDELKPLHPAVNQLLVRWMDVENGIFRSSAFPIGVSAFVEGVKV